MAQDLNRVAKTYDTVSKEYADTFSDEHQKKPMDMKMLHGFSEMMRNRKPVWDLGCGPGHTAACLKKLGVEVSGLDISGEMIKQARKDHPDIVFRTGNMLELDFPDSTVAGITAFYAIIHFTGEQLELALGEMFRVLEPGGSLLLTFHIGKETIHISEFLGKKVDVDFMFFTVDFIRDLLRRTGFINIEITEREPYPDVEYQSRRAYVFAGKS